MVTIGVDLGGTNIAVGVVDSNYRLLGKGSLKTHPTRSPMEIFQDMRAAAEIAMAQAGVSWDEIACVGVGTPGTPNQETGIIEFAGNLNFRKVPAVSMITKIMGKPIYMDNDASCAAYGEFKAGAGEGCHSSMVAITLGTGVGGGIILNGKIFSGHNYAGGELGHMVIDINGAECTCGRLGCWEAYASATALIRQTKDAMRRDPDSYMWELVEKNIDLVSGRTAFEAMRCGDPAGKRVVDQYIYYVACGIINTINIFQPEMLCVGGGISKEGETLLAPIRKYVEHERFSVYASKQTKIVKAQLGNDAGIIGAALLGEQAGQS